MPSIPESDQLRAWRAVPGDTEVSPGITAADSVEFCAVPPVPDGVRLRTVRYREVQGVELAMLLWSPSGTTRPRPGVIFVHGGGWAGGDPLFHARHASELAALGFVTATIQYRLSVTAPWPAALDDARAAVTWVREQHQELGLDPARVAVAGGSAGGHLSAMVAVTGGHAAEAVQAAVLWYPITDMRRAHPDLDPAVSLFLTGTADGLAGAGALLDAASPITHVTPACPPILTMTGDADAACPLPMIEDFHRRLDSAGVSNELVVYPGAGHGWDLSLKSYRPSFDVMVAFLDQHLRGHS
ncbi:MAG: alpha/beta hydrolase [Candidatus Dormibacteria bacterium]